MALEVVGWWLWWFFCMNRTQYVPGKTTSERQLIHACSTSLSSPVLTRMTRIDTKSWNWSTYQGRPGKVMLDAIFCVLFLRRIIICHSNCFRNSTCQDLPLLARSRCHVNIKGSPLHSSHWWCWVFNVLQRKTTISNIDMWPFHHSFRYVFGSRPCRTPLLFVSWIIRRCVLMRSSTGIGSTWPNL